MKFLIIMTTSLVISALANAGDNGTYTVCRSASGRTVLTMGQVGSASHPETVELKIDNKSIGAAAVGEDVILTYQQNGTLLKYTEADHEGADLLTIKMGSLNDLAKSRGKILSGLDPRTLKPLTKQIDVRCKLIFNPI